MTDARTFVFELAMPIRWGDMDAMGHVNNTVYFRYMEQCRISWFDAIGWRPDPNGHGPIIVNASCEFRVELRYPGTVRVRQYVGEIGRSSFQTHVELLRDDDPGTICAQGAARIVWVDYPRRKAVPMPPHVRDEILVPRVPLV